MRITGPPRAVTAFKKQHIIDIPAKPIVRYDGQPAVDEAGNPYLDDPHTQFDFNTIIPQPKCLEGITAGSTVMQAVEAITGKSLDQLVAEHNPDDPHAHMRATIKREYKVLTTPEREKEQQEYLKNLPVAALEEGLRAIEAIAECGYPTWYEWSVAHWGTKWNSYDFIMLIDRAGQLQFRFETAWNTPDPVLYRMAELHPELEFSFDSFDEGWGFATHGEGGGGTMVIDLLAATAERYELAYGDAPDGDPDDDPERIPTLDDLADTLQSPSTELTEEKKEEEGEPGFGVDFEKSSGE